MSEETIPQMRETIDRLEKQVKETTKANTALANENRVLSARDVFGEAGYAKSQGELFAAQNPEGEITPEAINEFVEKYGVAKVAPVTENEGGEGDSSDEGESDPTGTTGSPALGALSRSGSGAGEGGAGGSDSKTLTREEWQELNRTDPVAAKAAVHQGRVQISRDNVYADTPAPPGNPYART